LDGRRQVLEHSALWQAELFEGPDEDYLAVMKGLFNKIVNAHMEISDVRVKLDKKEETIQELRDEIVYLKEQFDAGVVKGKGKKNKNIANEHPDLKVRVIMLLCH